MFVQIALSLTSVFGLIMIGAVGEVVMTKSEIKARRQALEESVRELKFKRKQEDAEIKLLREKLHSDCGHYLGHPGHYTYHDITGYSCWTCPTCGEDT